MTSASGLFADQVAEQTLALLLGLLRVTARVFPGGAAQGVHPPADRRSARHHDRHPGFGGNGRRLAELLTHFHTRILATDYFPVDRPAYVERLLPPDATRSRCLPQCDIVDPVRAADRRDARHDRCPALAAMKPRRRADQCRSRSGGRGGGAGRRAASPATSAAPDST